ncbi:MAG: hypothetical protein JWN39_2442 [Ilumatobacteraceae bacterium]|nr:hypothetical protein [Ilumatobacteraceae bacterium]
MATAVAACSSTSDASSVPRTAPIGTIPPSGADAAAVETPRNPPRENVPPSIAMVGDSITALSKDTIEAVLKDVGFTSVTVNAEPGRRIEVGTKPTPGLEIVKFIAASNPVPQMWVIALGTNDDGLYADDSDYQGLIDDMLGAIPSTAPLVWVSTYRNDQLAACERFNLLMRASLRKRGHATVGEWYQAVTKSKESILTHDGVHPNADGILVFADTVRAAIATQLS